MDPLGTPASADTAGSSVGAPKYQSVAFRKALPDDAQQVPPRVGYATPEAAAMRCKELGFDNSDLEEHDDAFLYHQKAAPVCKSGGEPDIQDIEDGCRGIACGPEADAALTPDEHGYDEVPPTKTVRAIPKLKAGFDVTGGSGERSTIAGGNDTTLPRVPAGAQFIKDYSGHHAGALAMHDEHSGMLDNPAVSQAHDTWHEEDAARADEMNGMIGELYPEISFPDSNPSPGVSDGVSTDSLEHKGINMDRAVETAISDKVGAQEGDRNADQTIDDNGMRAENGDIGPAVDSNDMPYGASYLQKMAGHCDAGKAMLEGGLKKQEHPKVIDFAHDELGRLDKRKSACKKIMTKQYPDHADAVFPDEAEEETDKPEPKTKPRADEDPDPKKTDEAEHEPAGDEDPDPKKVTETEAETEPEKEDDKKPKPKKAAPATNADLLRAVVKGLADLTKSVAARTVPAPKPAPAAVAKAAPEPEPDPETVKLLADLQAENVRLAKQVKGLVENEKRFQMKLASKIGLNGKKKAECECGGTCGSCQTRSYFTEKTLSAIDESAGAALVPPPATKPACPKCKAEKVETKGGACTCKACGHCWNADGKKSYHIAATLKGRAITVKPGNPVPFFASDWRIESSEGELFDNRIFADFPSAERMLMQLA